MLSFSAWVAKGGWIHSDLRVPTLSESRRRETHRNVGLSADDRWTAEQTRSRGPTPRCALAADHQ